MERAALPSVSRAFARIAWRTLVVLLVIAFAVFGLAARRLVRTHEQQHLSEQALLCASMIRSGDAAEFAQVAATLQVHSPEFVALAVVDDTGRVSDVYPDTPQHVDAARAALRAVEDNPPADTSIIDRATELVAVPMPMQESCLSQKRVFAVFDLDTHIRTLIGPLLLLGTFVGILAVGAFASLCRWFERHVAAPLRSFAALAPDQRSVEPSTIHAGRMRETAGLARTLQEFVKALAETDARAKKVKEETLRELRDREAGFDRQLRRARDQATTDPLTRLRNRAFLDDTLESLFTAHQEGGQPLAAVMVDLDNFKAYNDRHGHQVGDALLRFVGSLLRGSIRPTDHAVRYGGDEFLLLLPNTSIEQAATIAGRIVKLFGQYSSCLQQDHRLSMSAGIAGIPDDRCADGQALVCLADQALYTAKFDGKSRIVTTSVRPAKTTDPTPTTVA